MSSKSYKDLILAFLISSLVVTFDYVASLRGEFNSGDCLRGPYFDLKVESEAIFSYSITSFIPRVGVINAQIDKDVAHSLFEPIECKQMSRRLRFLDY